MGELSAGAASAWPLSALSLTLVRSLFLTPDVVAGESSPCALGATEFSTASSASTLSALDSSRLCNLCLTADVVSGAGEKARHPFLRGVRLDLACLVMA